MANHILPTTSSLYTDVLANLKDRIDDSLKMLDSVNTTPTNVPTNAVRFNSTTYLWEKYNGTAWVSLASLYGISVQKATNLIGGNSTTLKGAIPYQSNTDATTLLAPNITTTRKFLRMTGTGTNGAVPVWDAILASDIPTLNQNTTGSAAKTSNIIGGNSTTLLGAMPYQSNTDVTTLLAPNTTTTRKFLRMTGTGANGAVPVWDAILAADIPTLNQNTTGSAAKSTNLIGGNSTTLKGAIPYQSNTDVTTLLAPNITTTRKFLRMTGTGGNGAAPVWEYIPPANKVLVDSFTCASDTTTLDLSIAQIVSDTEYDEITIEVSWNSFESGISAYVYLNNLLTHANYRTISWALGSATKSTYNIAASISAAQNTFARITLKKIGTYGYYVYTESRQGFDASTYNGGNIVYNMTKYAPSFLTSITQVTLAGIAAGAFKAGTVVKIYQGF